MVRHDFACKKCEGTFTIWSDSAKVCPLCGSKRIFKVFLTPTAFNTGNPAKIEKLAEQQLEAAGLSNYSNAGGTIRRTRKTNPAQLQAERTARANNLPIVTGPAGRLNNGVKAVNDFWVKQGANGVIQRFGGHGETRITTTPRGPGELVSHLMNTGGGIRNAGLNPYTRPIDRLYKPDHKDESAKLKAMMGDKNNASTKGRGPGNVRSVRGAR